MTVNQAFAVDPNDDANYVLFGDERRQLKPADKAAAWRGVT